MPFSRWDAVLDTCGFHGPTVAASAALLADSVAHYGFVSSVSAYRDWPAARIDETSVAKEPGSGEDYGAGKVAAEHAVEAAIPGRVLISRPGPIVGTVSAASRRNVLIEAKQVRRAV